MTAHATTLAGLEGALRPEHEGVVALVAAGLARVEERIDQRLASDLPPVQDLVDHVERYRGKMLRPTLTLLAGLAAAETLGKASDPLTDEHIQVAAVVELVHLATLVHDDVLDEADTRRRSPTVNRLRGNETAVILGDYLFAAAFHMCSAIRCPDTAMFLGAVTIRICEGELLQLHHRDDFAISPAMYFEIVQRKTAALIGAACDLGAAFAGAGPDARKRFRDAGANLGVAFQIQDDLLDLTADEATLGKSVGKDLEKGKLTLPWIHHLAHADPATRAQTLSLLEGLRTPSPDAPARIAQARANLERTRSIDHARDEARRRVQAAKDRVPIAGPAASLFHAAADAVVQRTF